MKKRTGLQTFEGYVAPGDWDENGEVIGLELVTEEDSDIRIEHSGRGADLMDYIDEYVEIRGTVTKKQGLRHLLVKDFEVMDAPEVFDWDEEGDAYDY